MKTAMQELIERLKTERLSNPVSDESNIGLTVAISFATELLEKEKQMVIDAVNQNVETNGSRQADV